MLIGTFWCILLQNKQFPQSTSNIKFIYFIQITLHLIHLKKNQKIHLTKMKHLKFGLLKS
jgi:hypothetical protein